jgi:hypothetical protein
MALTKLHVLLHRETVPEYSISGLVQNRKLSSLPDIDTGQLFMDAGPPQTVSFRFSEEKIF